MMQGVETVLRTQCCVLSRVSPLSPESSALSTYPGYWTIGRGHLCPPDHPPVTEAQAESYLAADMAAALAATLRYCPVLLIQPENRLAAIVDFTFNLGAGRLQTSTLRRRINQTDWAGARLELRKWVHGGGRVLPGLVARRQAEIALLRQ